MSEGIEVEDYGLLLLEAANDGDQERVKQFLENENVDLDYKDEDGRTALSKAAEQGHDEVVRLLLEQECIDPNSQDKDKRTPLSWAVSMTYPLFGDGWNLIARNCAVVKLLLSQSKVDLNLKDINEQSPLLLAVKLRKVEIVEQLLQEGLRVDPNAEDKYQRTPLSWAVEYDEEHRGIPLGWSAWTADSESLQSRYQSYPIVRLLLNQYNIDPNLKDLNGHASLSRAAELGKVEIVRLLFQQEQRVDPNSMDNDNRTPLLLAIQGYQRRAKIDASLTKMYSMIEILINQGNADLNRKDINGRTPLSQAVELGYNDLVEMLLKNKTIDPNVRDVNGRTPLSRAAELQSFEIVQMLLNAGNIDVNAEDKQGLTPFSWAVKNFIRNGHSVATLLINHESFDPNVKNIDGCTPILRAVELGHDKLVEMLLNKKKIDPNVSDINGRTPLSRAAELDRCEAAEMLVKADNIDINARDDQGRTALLWAVDRGQRGPGSSWHIGSSSVAKLLINQDNIDLNGKDIEGRTPLLRAVELGYDTLVEMLLNKKRIDPNVSDINGRTPLSRAAELDRYEAVQILLETENIDINAKDKQGRTPLSWAVESSQSKTWSHTTQSLAKLLISQGNIDINVMEINGRTPLSRAAELGHYKIVKMLLEEETTDPDSKDKQGRTPLSWAVECIELEKYYQDTSKNWKYTIQALLQHNVDPNSKDIHGRTPLSRAAELGHIGAVIELLEDNRIDPDLKDDNGRTPLWWAAWAGRENVVAHFLDRCTVDPESTDSDSKTPLFSASENNHVAVTHLFLGRDRITLHIAVRQKNLGLAKFLIKAKYSPNIKDMHGQTPLHVAASLGHTDVAKELIQSQADVNCEDVNGATPLRIAIQKKQQDVIQLLLGSSARTTGILLNDWLDAYNQKTQSVVMELSQRSDEKKYIRFIEGIGVQMCLEPESIKRHFLFVNYDTWFKYLACSLDAKVQIKESQIFHETQVHQKCDNIFVIGCFPTKSSGDQDGFTITHWNKCGVAWTVIRPSNAKDGSYWRSTNHYGTLPYGWTPNDSAEFFALFIRNLEENWLVLCNFAEEHLSKRRTDQLSQMGSNPKLIRHLAKDAQQWAMLRKVLRGQVSSANEFAEEYCRRYDQGRGLSVMQAAIDRLSGQVTDQIDRLEQTVKDLLQLEFAWVSVNEAHRSTTLATSIKRLSWITFIFLPPMFVSSLFGMNVNILETNPDWRWYLLFGGGCVVLTVSVWLLFKFGQIETLVEKYIGTPLQQYSEHGMRRIRRKKSSHNTLP